MQKDEGEGKVDWEEFAPGKDEEVMVIQSTMQTSLSWVQVCLHRSGGDSAPDLTGKEYKIYGQISVTDDPENPAITLFDRSRHNPQLIQIGDPFLGFIPLSDHHLSSVRPLDHPRTILYLNFQLHIAVDDAPDIDILIAKFNNYAHKNIMCEKSCSFLVDGESEFFFRVNYAVFAGTRVQVDLTINRNLNLNPNPNPPQAQGQGEFSASKRQKLTPDDCNSVCGVIDAFQWFGGTESVINLYLKFKHDLPTSVPVGSSIPLHRSIIITPVQRPALLYIEFTLCNSDNGDLIACDQLIAFPIKELPNSSYPPKFITNKHHKHVKHILGGLITASITFLDH